MARVSAAHFAVFIGRSLLTVNRKKARQDKDTADASGTIIAVMGVTGSGKSHLIQQIAGSQDVGVGDGLTSCQLSPSDQN